MLIEYLVFGFMCWCFGVMNMICLWAALGSGRIIIEFWGWVYKFRHYGLNWNWHYSRIPRSYNYHGHTRIGPVFFLPKDENERNKSGGFESEAHDGHAGMSDE